VLTIAVFTANSLLSFVVGLLVAKFLGPAEYGRFTLALSAAFVMQLLVFVRLRYCVPRFYTRQDQAGGPQIRATLEAAVGWLAVLAAGVALLVYASGLDLALKRTNRQHARLRGGRGSVPARRPRREDARGVACARADLGKHGRRLRAHRAGGLAWGLINYAINPAFQLAHRLAPLMISALVAVLANLATIVFLPTPTDASVFALAQSESALAGLASLFMLLGWLEPSWPKPRDMIVTLAAPVRRWSPWTCRCTASRRDLRPCCRRLPWGGGAYVATAAAPDVEGLRSLLAPRLVARFAK